MHGDFEIWIGASGIREVSNLNLVFVYASRCTAVELWCGDQVWQMLRPSSMASVVSFDSAPVYTKHTSNHSRTPHTIAQHGHKKGNRVLWVS